MEETVAALHAARTGRDVAAARSIAAHLRAGGAPPALLHRAGLTLLELDAPSDARACLEIAAERDGAAAIRNDLGVALQRSGRFEDAIAAYEAALEREPGKVDSHLNLASALLVVGRPAAAKPHVEVAAAAFPAAPSVNAIAALIDGMLEGYERTIERLDVLGSGDPIALQIRLYALRRLERYAEAAIVGQRLVETAPTAESYELFAACQRDLGLHREALTSLDEAVARAQNPGSALAAAGEVLIELGDIEEATRRFRAATDADPMSVGGWHGRARLERFAAGDPALAAMEALLDAPHLAARDQRVLLLFALASAQLATGNDVRAFELFAEGNRLQRTTIAYDAADDERHMAAIAHTFDAATIARLRAPAARARPPIVVMGLPRSGTTLVEQILATFPGVHGAGETLFARSVIEAAIDYPAGVASVTPERVAALGDAYADALATKAPTGTRVVDKLPANFLYAGLLHAMLPGASLVLCTRDPLDNGFSLYTELFSGRQDFAYDLIEIGRYIRAQQRLVAHWRAVLPPGAMVEVAYEDLVTDFEPTVRRLAGFCGLEWTDAVHRFWETPRTVSTASRIAVRRPLFRTSIGRGTRYAAYLEPLIRTLAAP